MCQIFYALLLVFLLFFPIAGMIVFCAILFSRDALARSSEDDNNKKEYDSLVLNMESVRNKLGDAHFDYLKEKAILAFYCFFKFSYVDKAFDYMNEIIESCEINYGKTDYYLHNVSHLADFYFNNGDREKGIKVSEDNIDSWEKIIHKSQTLMPYINALRRLYDYYIIDNQDHKAIEQGKKVLKILYNIQGNKSEDTLTFKTILALLYLKNNDIVTSKELLTQLLSEFSAIYDKNDLRVARVQGILNQIKAGDANVEKIFNYNCDSSKMSVVQLRQPQ